MELLKMINIYKNICDNIVMPLGVVDVEKKGIICLINYNTYLKLSPTFKRAIYSSVRGGSPYHLKKADLNYGFYYTYKELNLKINIPFNSLMGTNDKLNGILGLPPFSSAKNCPSHKRGTCQVPSGDLCYARQGEGQATPKSFKILEGMGSYYNAIISRAFWNDFKSSHDLRERFFKYIEYYNINIVRYNIKGDFMDIKDIKILEYIHKKAPALKLYGYTARDDLYNSLLSFINHDNIYLNGSNIKYTNRFYCTTDIKEYLNATYKCKGDCAICGNCYNLKGKVIYVLLHGAGSDTYLKNANNIEYLTLLINHAGLKTTCAEFYSINLKGLQSSFNKILNDKKATPIYGIYAPAYNKKGDLINSAQSFRVLLKHLNKFFKRGL